MCEKDSFVLTRGGKVLDGCGLTHSHTTIMNMHGLTPQQHDTCNLYEWRPPKGWPGANWADGLVVDRQQFEPKQRATDAMRRRIMRLYPDMAAWEATETIRWDKLPLPNAERVHRMYDLASQAKPLAAVDDAVVLEHVNRHLTVLGCNVVAMRVADASIVRYGVWDSMRYGVWDSVWDGAVDSACNSVRASVRASVWDDVRWGVRASACNSVRASVWASMVKEDADNPWLPLAELATHGAYLYGVSDDGTAYVWKAAA